MKLLRLYGFDKKKLDQIGFFSIVPSNINNLKFCWLIWDQVIDFKFITRGLSTKDVAFEFSIKIIMV